MTHHDHIEDHQYDEAEAEANSTVDMYAILGIVLIVVAVAVYLASR